MAVANKDKMFLYGWLQLTTVFQPERMLSIYPEKDNFGQSKKRFDGSSGCWQGDGTAT